MVFATLDHMFSGHHSRYRKGRLERRVRLFCESLEDRSLPSTFTVISLGDTGEGSGLQGDLRFAINTANANPDLTNRIVFQPGLTGTITLTQGPLPVTKDLAIDGPGESVVAVSGNHRSGVFNISTDPRVRNVRFADLTITNGTGILNPRGDGFQGGGIYNDHAALTLTRVAIVGNSVSGAELVQGGGIFNGTGSLVLNSATVANNQQTGRFGGGAGIYSASVSSAITVIDSTFANNSAVNVAGIATVGRLTVLRSNFSNNSAGGGQNPASASAIEAGPQMPATIADSTFTGNFAPDGGWTINTNAHTTITDSTIANNLGTGIFNGGGLVEITGCTISGNRTTFSGGGIATSIGDTHVTNSTISGNTAETVPRPAPCLTCANQRIGPERIHRDQPPLAIRAFQPRPKDIWSVFRGNGMLF